MDDGRPMQRTADLKRKGAEVAIAKMRRAQDIYLAALGQGDDEDTARGAAGVTENTLRHWRYHKAGAETYRQREKQARLAGQAHLSGAFPSFLTFRERHFAYVDVRKGIHPKTGRKWVVRATNNWYQTDTYSQLQGTNRLVMVLPPGHLKTTTFGIELATWDIMRDRDVRLLAVSRSQEEAKKVLAAVQHRLSDHDYYHEMRDLLIEQGDLPVECPLCEYEGSTPFKPQGRSREADEKWGAESFIVAGRSSGEKDASMEAKGVGSQIQGVRADRIVLDDVQDPEMAVRSPKDSDDKLGWFRRVIMGRVSDMQQVVVLANFFTPDDFAHKLITAEPGFSVVNYPAIRTDKRGKEHLLCPEYWTHEGLMQKKGEVGDEAWFFTWMQEEGGHTTATFKREALEDAKDPEFRLGDVPYQVTDTYIGCDPATAAGGFCAIVVWGLDRNSKQRYLIDVFNSKGMRNIDNVVNQLLEMARTYSPRKVIVESNAQQKAFIHSESFQRGVRSMGLRYETYQTVTGTGGRAQASNFDITTIGALFDGGLITLPGGGTNEQLAKVDSYIDQLCSWRTDEQGNSLKYLVRDMVMATLFAESEAFLQANRPTDRNLKIRSQQQVPRWAKGRLGGYAWQDRYKKEPV